MKTYLKERLYDPKSRLMGMFIKLPSTETIEMIAYAGCDFVIIDMEHAPYNIETVYQLSVVADLHDMACLVRLPGHNMGVATQMLDAGVAGILVPHCSPYDEAKTLIESMVFPPHGGRGAGGGQRAGRWGFGPREGYRDSGDTGVVRVPMIEDPEAIEDIDRILGIHGVDAIFIGQGDLTQTLGAGNPRIQELVQTALGAANAKGIPACTTATAADLESRFTQGFKWLTVGNDTGLFARAVEENFKTVKAIVDGLKR